VPFGTEVTILACSTRPKGGLPYTESSGRRNRRRHILPCEP